MDLGQIALGEIGSQVVLGEAVAMCGVKKLSIGDYRNLPTWC